MTAIISILAFLVIGSVCGWAAEISEQRRLKDMADEVRRRGL